MTITAEIPRSRALCRRVMDDERALVAPPPRNDPVRLGLVQSIQAAIAAGTYETDDKLDIALDRLLDDVLRCGPRPIFAHRRRRAGGRVGTHQRQGC